MGLAFVEKLAAVMVLLPLLFWLVAGALLGRPLAPRGVAATGSTAWSRLGRDAGPAVRWRFSRSRSFNSDFRPRRCDRPFRPPAGERLAGSDPGHPDVWSGFCGVCSGWLSRRARSGGSSGPHSRPGRPSWRSPRWSPGWATRPGGARRYLAWLIITCSASGGRTRCPTIQIIYFGQVYDFSLPWHNACVLLAITVPVAILAAGAIGLVWALRQFRRDRLPLYFLSTS